MKQRNRIIGSFQLNRIYTDSKTVTVGYNQDFTLLDDALTWVRNCTLVGNAEITLMLSDQVHYISDKNTHAHLSQTRLTIRSASSSRDNCIITVSEDVVSPFAVITCYYSFVRFLDLTFDMSLPEIDTSSMRVLYSQNNSYMIVSSCLIIGGGTQVSFSDNSAGIVDRYGWSSVSSVLQDGQTGISLSKFSSVKFQGSVDITGAETGIATIDRCNVTQFSTGVNISGCTTGISSTGGSAVILPNTTMSTNGSDTNIPWNEIQYDGSYISNEQAGLTLKA